MKTYKYTFSKLITALLIFGIVLAVSCIGLNLYALIVNLQGNYEITGYDWFKFILIFALGILFIVLGVACLISSYYKVENKTIILKWGLIKNEFDLREVNEVKYNKEKNRLELIFNDESYFYVSTKTSWVYDLVSDIKAANSKIIYIEDSSETDAKN